MAVTPQEIEQHLRAMNTAWRLYAVFEDNPYASPESIDPIADRFEQECRWLEEHGVAWMSLGYDRETKQHSLGGAQ